MKTCHSVRGSSVSKPNTLTTAICAVVLHQVILLIVFFFLGIPFTKNQTRKRKYNYGWEQTIGFNIQDLRLLSFFIHGQIANGRHRPVMCALHRSIGAVAGSANRSRKSNLYMKSAAKETERFGVHCYNSPILFANIRSLAGKISNLEKLGSGFENLDRTERFRPRWRW